MRIIYHICLLFATMRIELHQAGKRYNRDWIFKQLDYVFTTGSYAITGNNGSGKSTLLQTVAGYIGPSKGSITYQYHGNIIAPENVFNYIAMATPYLDLIEEMTTKELIEFQAIFKPYKAGIKTEKIIETCGLTSATDKQIRYFSSGMKQRLKLGLAFFADTPVLLLDEPCTNLDKSGIDIYLSLINDYCENRLVVVCSNDEQEISFCKHRLSIMDYK